MFVDGEVAVTRLAVFNVAKGILHSRVIYEGCLRIILWSDCNIQ